MANFDQLKQSVAALIRTNGAEEITGQIMQDVLLTIINSISGGYMFGGVAQHNGNVGNPDYNVFYLAGSGAYTGYGNAINIPDGCYGVFRYNGSWTQDVVDIGVHLTGTIREGETNGVTGDVINTALQQLFNNVMNILDTLTFTYNTPDAQKATKAMLDVIVTPTGGASHVLTTLTLVSATAAAAGLMSAEDKQKVDRMLTDFRSLSFSDTTAVADQATKIVQTLSATLGENPEAITTMTFLAATTSKAGLLSAADKAKLDALWSSGYQFAGIATPSTTPISTTSKIFYIATEAGTYFNAVTVTQGINILSWDGTEWSAVQVVGIDEEPIPGSDNLVKSGGVASVEGYYVDNPEFIKVELDAEGRIIRAIKKNGDIYFGAGIPSQIKASIDSLNDKKVDKEDGNSLINAEYAEGVEYTDNPEYIMAILDAEKRVIFTLDNQRIARVYSRRIATEDDLEALREELIDAMSDYVTPMIINPYEGVDMSNTVLSTTHEHYKTKETLQDAYNRGIRVFAVSDYSPAVPRYPLSNFNYDYLDYKSKEAVDGGDRELITKNFSGSIPVITIDNQDINTDTLPQIANAEHPFVKNQREHFNILGLVWGEPGQQLAGASGTANNSWKRKNAIITPALLNSFLEDESKWQFGSQYVFGTINHTKDFDYVKNAIDACPKIFKAMEIFSKGYSRGWNKEFRDTYDSILRHGYRIWGTSVADWPKSYGQWGYTTAEEKSEWIAKYSALPEEEKELYEDVADYYYQTAVYKFTRGANCVIVPSNYDSMTPEEKALEVVKSYIAGRYYLVGTGAHTLNVSVNGSMVTFRFSDICLNIRLVTGKEEFTYHDLDTVTYKMKKGDMYVRIEGDWDDGVDGDIVYSNPIWIE